MTADQRLIVVSGPTASGKTKLAVKLAAAIGAEVVNIDSVQLYRDLNVGAAKPTPSEMEGVPHHLLGFLESSDQFNVARYISAANEAIAGIRARGKPVILAGGSTMYITCLLQGLDAMPHGDSELRLVLEARSLEDLRKELVELDPGSAERISPRDKLRTVRALEAVKLTGKPASLLRDEHLLNNSPAYRAAIFIPCYERAVLYDRINQRAREMVAEGIISETAAILEENPAAPALRSLGYAQAVEHLRGRISSAELPEAIAQFTRRFAKRQMTYWRNEPPKKGWEVFPLAGEGTVLSESFAVLDWEFDALLSKARESINAGGPTRVYYLNGKQLF